MESLLRPSVAALLSMSLLAKTAMAHEGHGDSVPEGETISAKPLDAILWVHIFTQMIAYGVIFPIGMVFGMTKSRWHVPTQIVGTIFAVIGFFLGHAHGGRDFLPSNAHARFAWILHVLLGAQIVLGLYLKGHWEKGVNGRVRKLIRPMHSVIGKAMPIVSWTQMLFGGITALGFCQGEHVGQCVAHFIMGSAFVAYGIIMMIILVVGQVWIRRTGRSQEFYDSSVIAIWGCINTFTEHRWGTAWVRNDWQHTTMGIVWWCAGLAGIWLSRDRDGNPQRNFIPGFVLAITGWAMSAHPQELMVSAETHSMFGKTLMMAGATRIIEVAFVLRDKQSVASNGRKLNSFQYIPIFLLFAAGFLFMSATEEQMELVAASDLDHVSYILIIYSIAFMVFLFSNVVIHIWDRNANELPPNKNIAASGRAMENGQLREAEEYELDGLISDEEDDESRGMLRRSEGDGGSHSTVGRNNEQVAP